MCAGAWLRASQVAGHHLRRGEVFAKKVSDMSGGKFQISVHAGGELLPPFGIVDGVQNGTDRDGPHGAVLLLRQGPTFAIGAAIPFGLNSRQMTPGCSKATA
jgi:TRAP-type mannitol/chloroaromatic compound transport system substrate-binding protein